MEPVRILIVDNHRMIREAWAMVLNHQQRFRVMGMAANIPEAKEFLQQKPDIQLLDLHMGKESGEELLQFTTRNYPEVKTVVVSMYSMPAVAKKAIAFGAMGYVTKNSDASELVEAVYSAYRGDRYICAAIKESLALTLFGNVRPGLQDLSAR